jgi:hypothetical protein
MIIDKIIAYENGELTDLETVSLFSDLIKSGTIRGLQGHYHRKAQHLVDLGVLSSNGDIHFREFVRMQVYGGA